MTSPLDIITSADYIIIGGGTAGLVVANRLTENPDVQVLVLEAGNNHDNDIRVQVPAFWTRLTGSEVDWKYGSVPQAGLNGRSIKDAQGKLLGGSSAINSQTFVAPAQADIDAWAKLGNNGWDWSALAPYYKKSYTLSPPPDRETLEHLGIDWINDEYRGTSGPVQVSFQGVDPFSGNLFGGYSNAATVDITTKTRSYAANAYRIPALQRPNLLLVTDATVHKILFENTSGGVTAIGVLASVQGETKKFSAGKEVIIAAGAFNTPKLLELSGAGDETLLEKQRVSVVINNPNVGEHMQNHLMTGVSFEVVDGITTGDPLLRQDPKALEFVQKLYNEEKAGPFTIGGIQSHAFMPVLEFSDEKARERQAELLTSLLENPPNPKDNEYLEIVRSIIESPAEWAKLRGSIHISSSNIDDAPEVDPRFFSHPTDLEIFARHIQSLETLRQTEGLSAFFKPGGKRIHPDAFNIHTLEGAKKYALDTATTTYHTCGTTAMLPKEKGGVVHEKLIVYGTNNLRVVDASIFPLIPRGNILSSVYAVAEKAADVIKGV